MSDHTERFTPPLPESWGLSDGTIIEPGSRIRFAPTTDRGHPVRTGDTGEVTRFTGAGMVYVHWDRGGYSLADTDDLAGEATQ